MQFADPHGNAQLLRLHEGMKVADIGTGSGEYLAPLSRAVGTAGAVYAIDIQEELVKRAFEIARTKKLENVRSIWGDVEHMGGTRLPDASVDAVLLSNVLFQLTDVYGALHEVKRILKPGGLFLIIDWRDSYKGLGPSKAHVVPPKKAEELATGTGFLVVGQPPAGPHHYALLLKRA